MLFRSPEVQEVAVEAADNAPEVPQEVVDAIDGGEEAVGDEEGGVIPVDLGSLTLAELSDMFDKLSQADDRMKRYKEAEAIKSAFYKKLSKEKAEAGLGAKVDEPSSREDVIDEVGTRQSRVKKGRFCTRINRYSYSRVHNAVIFTRDYF